MKRAEIVTLACSSGGGLVGLRIEETSPGQWMITWSFAMEARNEYAGKQSSIAGNFAIAPDIPACPRCDAHGFVKCGQCEKLTCFDGATGDSFTCNWWGAQAEVGGLIDSLESSGDA